MFRIANVYVQDKDLASVLHALAGKVIKMDVPQPVANATVSRSGEIVAESSGSLRDMFVQHLSTSREQEIKMRDVKAWLESKGKPVLSANYLIGAAQQMGVLKRIKTAKMGTGHPSSYQIVKQLTFTKPKEGK